MLRDLKIYLLPSCHCKFKIKILKFPTKALKFGLKILQHEMGKKKSNPEKSLLQDLAGAFSFHKAIVPDYIGNKEFLEINYFFFFLIFPFLIWLLAAS